MSEDSELKEEAENLVAEFMDLPQVRKYFKLKKAILEDSNLQKLKKEAKFKRKLLAEAGTSAEQLKLIAEARELERQFCEDPKVVNLGNLKEEVDRVLGEISNLFS